MLPLKSAEFVISHPWSLDGSPKLHAFVPCACCEYQCLSLPVHELTCFSVRLCHSNTHPTRLTAYPLLIDVHRWYLHFLLSGTTALKAGSTEPPRETLVISVEVWNHDHHKITSVSDLKVHEWPWDCTRTHIHTCTYKKWCPLLSFLACFTGKTGELRNALSVKL